MASEAGRHNLLSYLEELPRFGKREAYLWREGVRWRRLTYRVLHRRALGCAKTLAEMGLEPGGAVLIEGPDSGHWSKRFWERCALVASPSRSAPAALESSVRRWRKTYGRGSWWRRLAWSRR
jgi:hypothetical protein